MLRKIITIKDLKAELTRYFETMRALPAPKRPGYAKNHLWQEMITPEQTSEDIDEAKDKFCPTRIDEADAWYIDENFMHCLTVFEYKLLSARLREKPIGWKIICYRFKKTRQMLDIYMKKALDKLFYEMRF